MEYVTFGRTGLQVSVAGIGTGGASQIGIRTGADETYALRLLQRSKDLGVNYFDTSQTGQSEALLGKSFRHCRSEVILSSKFKIHHPDGSLLKRSDIRSALEGSLRNLQTSYLDIYHVHSLGIDDYDYCSKEFIPELLDLQKEGLIRFIGVSEQNADPTHLMLQSAVRDNCWDAVLVTFNLFNQSARDVIFPPAIRNQLGVVIMSAARGKFSHPDKFREAVAQLCQRGDLAEHDIDIAHPFGFLSAGDSGGSVAATSYQLARDTPGTHVVLVGTGNLTHLEENIRSLNSPTLPPNDYDNLKRIFGHLCIEAPLD